MNKQTYLFLFSISLALILAISFIAADDFVDGFNSQTGVVHEGGLVPLSYSGTVRCENIYCSFRLEVEASNGNIIRVWITLDDWSEVKTNISLSTGTAESELSLYTIHYVLSSENYSIWRNTSTPCRNCTFFPGDYDGDGRSDVVGYSNKVKRNYCANPADIFCRDTGHWTDYDYSPSAIYENGIYKMWWCGGSIEGGVEGDHILYAESSDLDGPWHARSLSSLPNSYQVVFSPTGQTSPTTNYPNGWGFDSGATCDPSVVKVNGVYYMYYTGGMHLDAPNDIPFGGGHIGVAQSTDGLTWTRLNNGNPIIYPAYSNGPITTSSPKGYKYGTGQPSVVYVDGYFYLQYTDTTGIVSKNATGDYSGGGVYALRSRDPLFQSGVEELSSNGFVPYSQEIHTRFALFGGAASEWQYSDSTKKFIHIGGAYEGYIIRIFDFESLPGSDALASSSPYWPFISFTGIETDDRGEAGIVSTPEKHSITSSDNRVILDLIGVSNISHNEPDMAFPSNIVDWNLGYVKAKLNLTNINGPQINDVEFSGIKSQKSMEFPEKIYYALSSQNFVWNTHDILSCPNCNLLPISGDFDGDKKADLVAYNPSDEKISYALSSQNYGTLSTMDMPCTNCEIILGDYDGDGFSDIVGFDFDNGILHYALSSINYAWQKIENLGCPDCVFFPGDYDANGISDLLAYSKSSGIFYYALAPDFTFNSFSAPSCPNCNLLPISGDFDGDKKADIVAYDSLRGIIYYSLNSMNFSNWLNVITPCKDCTVINGDYDGDGKSDVVLYDAKEWTESEEACAGEGEHYSKVYSNYPKTCCDGLTEWDSGMDTRTIVNGTCVETGGVSGNPVGTCIKCGDGVCGFGG